jgi:hypothetical protein
VKRFLPIFIILLTAVFSTSAAEQGGALDFALSRHDFGTIAEDGGAVCQKFAFTNKANKPIVILDVTGGCSCTKAKFERQPVLPSKGGEIEICFDPMNQPEGSFFRKIVITTSVSRQTISISGSITPRKKSIEEQYPLILGGALRIEQNYHSFGYVEHGKAIGSSFGLINTSDTPLTITLIPSQESGHLSLHYPKTLAPHQSGVIDFGYNLAAECNKYGTLQDILYIDINSTRSPYPLIINGIAIDNRKINTDKEWQKIQLSENFIKFGTLKHSNKAVSRHITVSNIGLEPLIIRAIECDNKAFSAALVGKSVIDSDSESLIEVRFNPSTADFGAVVGSIMIITNDPQQPSKRLKVTAIVEK